MWASQKWRGKGTSGTGLGGTEQQSRLPGYSFLRLSHPCCKDRVILSGPGCAWESGSNIPGLEKQVCRWLHEQPGLALDRSSGTEGRIDFSRMIAGPGCLGFWVGSKHGKQGQETVLPLSLPFLYPLNIVKSLFLIKLTFWLYIFMTI